MLNQLEKRITEGCSPERTALLRQVVCILGAPLETAPASTAVSRHHAWDGGLLAHIHQMLDLIELVDIDALGVKKESLITGILLHDISKTVDASGNPYYVPNVLKSGKVSEAKPYEINKAYLHNGVDLGINALPSPAKEQMQQYAYILANFLKLNDGQRSMSLIYALVPKLAESLTEEENQAILWHGGAYEGVQYSSESGKETNLLITLHFLDMLSSRNDKIQFLKTKQNEQ